MEDQSKHLRILNDIMTIFEDDEHIKSISAMNSEEEIIHTMESLIEKKSLQECDK